MVLFLFIAQITIGQTSRSVILTKTFTSSGTFSLTDLTDIPDFDPSNEIFAVAQVDLLLVGGGGGGGRGAFAAGGGGGAVVTQSIDLNLGATLSITIGNGGQGARQGSNNSNNGLSGGNTIVSLTSGTTSINRTASGGSGGNGNGNGGNSGNGNPGGSVNGSGQNVKGGGGGGAGGPGTGGFGTGVNSTGGNGGNGVSVVFAGGIFGAGGGGNSRNGGLGGNGGGGDANPSGPGGNGFNHSGAGGGAGSASATGGNGANGKVVVQIAYRILPVQFASFHVEFDQKNRTARIEWSTAKEWQSSHFEIERALNSVKEWKVIGEVSGVGFSDEISSYSFEDNALPAAGGNIFYRIKQVDFDQNFSYSNTKAIFLDPLAGQQTWIAYPNPSSAMDPIRVDILDPGKYSDEIIFVQVQDPMGRVASFSADSIEKINSGINTCLSGFQKGLVLVTFSWGNQRETYKILRK
ncbi:MAG: hypothetical protein LPK25_17620 [Cyclobacteriaceae bacterium]|nr:hypothetical protein [Cyclobacteriaceae bacterium]MDX5468173.1 hypothetical protein [Cyclobacteriaceae bacterium]